MLTHAAGYFGDSLINSSIHVLALSRGVDDDVVSAEENDFSMMSVFVSIEDGFGLDDLWGNLGVDLGFSWWRNRAGHR